MANAAFTSPVVRFRATARNAAGFTFQFSFANPNWNGIQAAADARLAALVAADPLHQANGPWTAGTRPLRLMASQIEPAPEITELQFDILRRAVTLARGGAHDAGVRRLAGLRARLVAEGNAEADVDAALGFWAQDLQARYPGDLDHQPFRLFFATIQGGRG